MRKQAYNCLPSRPGDDSGEELLFLFIGGSHQVLHLAPVAAELARRQLGYRITCLYRDSESGMLLNRVKDVMRADAMHIEQVPPPRWSSIASGLLHNRSLEKIPLLYRIAHQHRKALAVVAPERTSAALHRLGLHQTPLIHFRHGAGDRAPSSERRLNEFDLIVVPGEKDLARAMSQQGVDRSRLRSVGYVKFDFLSQVKAPAPPLFENERLVVLYNPHFDAHLSSWPVAQQVVERFRAQSRFNLVLAPHIRLRSSLSESEAARWKALAEPGKIIVDLDSTQLVDMSYTRAADIYLGDVSSQLYEFIHRPRPVAFINNHHVKWQGNPRYAGWALGEVANDVDDVIPAIERALESAPDKLNLQKAALEEAIGDWHGASARGADIIQDYLAQRASIRH